MDEDNQNARLWEIAHRFDIPEPVGLLGRGAPPFDTRPPTFHATKSEFNAELKAVEEALEHAAWLARFLSAPHRNEAEEKRAAQLVCAAIDEQARQTARYMELRHPSDLVIKNAAETDLTYTVAMLLLDVHSGFIERLAQLKEQERTYWTTKGRAPNHHARAIALRFAKLVAKHTGSRPTVGVSRDGNFPSTEFGRGVEEIFGTLGIEANFRRHAEWAVSQLNEEDYRSGTRNALSALLAANTVSSRPERNAFDPIWEALTKGQQK